MVLYCLLLFLLLSAFVWDSVETAGVYCFSFCPHIGKARLCVDCKNKSALGPKRGFAPQVGDAAAGA